MDVSSLLVNKTENNQSLYQRLWRPSMGWSYLFICVFDFFVAPILSAVFQAHFYPSAVFIPWNPITLGAGGLYHISMMAIVGVTAYSRGQEKMKLLDIIATIRNPSPSNSTSLEPILPPTETVTK